MIELPYFDLLLEGRLSGDPTALLFKRFVHWGYWDRHDPRPRNDQDYIAAMERLNEEILAPAQIKDGQAVLDAGCGFGATLDSINQKHRAMNLTGINIDKRQLFIASDSVKPRAGNTVAFEEGDACELPFAPNSFDVVLAVECIFHFESRQIFLNQAARVLKPGGRIALSDFVPAFPGSVSWPMAKWLERLVRRGYGPSSAWDEGSYAEMARKAGLELALDRDITAQTMPTYPFLLSRVRSGPARKLFWPTLIIYAVSLLRFARYRIVAFRKPA